jgi:DNA-binding response OmpR family regulator
MEVLVVGKSRLLRRLVRRALRQAGHRHDQVTEAATAEQAFDAVEAACPDLVLTQWQLPDGSGLQLLGRLRRAGSPVPVGLVTAERPDDLQRQAAEAGAAFVLGKPLTADDLRAALDGLADPGAATAAATAWPVEGWSSSLPHPLRVKALLEQLLAREVDLAHGDPVVPTLGTRVAVGAYVDERLRLRALVVTDLALAAHAGAAVGLLSPDAAARLISGDTLSTAVFDNVAEVLDVCTGLLNGPALPRLRLYACYSPSDVLPGDVSALLRSQGTRLDLTVEVVGYGAGGLSFVRG